MKAYSKRPLKNALPVSALVLLLAQFSCSSSSSEPEGILADAPFVNPTDAQTLRQALTTSSTLAMNSKYWECVADTNNRTLNYQSERWKRYCASFYRYSVFWQK